MGADDDADCEHVWQLAGVALIPGHGAPTEYSCTSCGAVLYRNSNEAFPGTV